MSGLDRATLEALYMRLEKPMYNVVYRWVWNAATAQDIVQEAFLRLWNMRERVDVATVEPLVYRIALNLASNKRRAAKLRAFVGLDATPLKARGQSPDDELAQRRQHHALRQAIDGLPERLRRVVMLCEFAGLTYAEVAETLDIAPGTVGSRRNEALAKLRAELGDWETADD